MPVVHHPQLVVTTKKMSPDIAHYPLEAKSPLGGSHWSRVKISDYGTPRLPDARPEVQKQLQQCCVIQDRSSHRAAPTAAAASPGNVLEIQPLQPCPGPASDALGWPGDLFSQA